MEVHCLKKILILLLLASNLCQPAYGFSLSSNNPLLSSIKNFISPYGTQLLETLSEQKTLFYGLAVAGAATFSLYAFKSHQKAKNEAERVEADKLLAQLIDNYNPQQEEEYFFATQRTIATILEYPNRERAIAYTYELIDQNVDINKANQKGYTPLMVAAKLGLTDLVRQFILLNANPCFINPHTEENALIYLLANPAAEHTYLSDEQNKTLELFLENENISKMLDAESALGNALIFAVRLNDIDLINTIINLKPELLNNTNNAGQTAFHIALINGNTEIANLLIEKGADIGICDIHNNSPLKSAIKSNQLSIAAWLMKKDSAFDEKLYQIALKKAVEQGDLENIESLIIAYSPEQSDSTRKIILDKTSLDNSENKTRILQLLTLSNELYTDGNFIKKLALNTDSSNSAIIGYVQDNKYNKIKETKVAYFDEPNSWSLTPLMIATILNHHKCVQELLRKGADTQVKLGNLSVEEILNNLLEQNLLKGDTELYELFERKEEIQNQSKADEAKEKKRLMLEALEKRLSSYKKS